MAPTSKVTLTQSKYESKCFNRTVRTGHLAHNSQSPHGRATPRHMSSQHTGTPAPPPPAAHLAAPFQVWVAASHATILRSCDLGTVCCTPKAS